MNLTPEEMVIHLQKKREELMRLLWAIVREQGGEVRVSRQTVEAMTETSIIEQRFDDNHKNIIIHAYDESFDTKNREFKP